MVLSLREITMGSTDSKLNFRKAVIQLTTKTQVLFSSAHAQSLILNGHGVGRGAQDIITVAMRSRF